MPTVIDDLIKLIVGKKERDPVNPNPEFEGSTADASFSDYAGALGRGAWDTVIGGLVNGPAGIAQALSPTDLSDSQRPLNFVAKLLHVEPVDLKSIRVDENGNELDLGGRVGKLTGLSKEYEEARKGGSGPIGATARAVSELTVAPLAQTLGIPIPGGEEAAKHRAQETALEKVERLPLRIAQASILYSALKGGLGFTLEKATGKSLPKPTLGPATRADRLVNREFARLNELAKSNIKQAMKEELTVTTPLGKGKIAAYRGNKTVVSMLDKTGKKVADVAFDSPEISIAASEVLKASGMRPGRLLLDPKKVQTSNLVKAGVLSMDKVFQEVVNEGGPVLGAKIGQVMREEPGTGVMEAIGRAVAQGEAPDVSVVELSKMLNITTKGSAELIAQSFKDTGALLEKGNLAFFRGKQKRKMALILDAAAQITPENQAILGNAARQLRQNPSANPSLLGKGRDLVRFGQGQMMLSPAGAMRDLMATAGRGILEAVEDFQTESLVAGKRVAQDYLNKLRGKNVPTRTGDIYRKTSADLEAWTLGMKDAVSNVRELMRVVDHPEFVGWVNDSRRAAFKGEAPPDFPTNIKFAQTPLDKLMELSRQFPDQFASLSHSYGGEAFQNMITIDQAAEIHRALGQAGRKPNIKNITHAVGTTLQTVTDMGLLMRTVGDIEARKIALAANTLQTMNKHGLDEASLMRRLRVTGKDTIDPILERDLLDGFERAREVTFGRRFEGSLAGEILNLWQKVPALHLVQPFPGFKANEIAFMWERAPFRIVNLAKNIKDFVADVSPEQIAAEMKARNIVGPTDSPMAQVITNELRSRSQENAARGIARFMNGVGMVSASMAIRSGKLAGPRWHQLDTQQKDAEGNNIIESMEYYQPWSRMLMVAEAVNKTLDGVPLQDVFSKAEFEDLIFGARALDQETPLALLDFADILSKRGYEGASDVALEILDSNIGKFMSTFRKMQEVGGMVKGEGELIIPEVRTVPKPFQRFVEALPDRFREKLIPDPEPRATLFESDGIAKRELTYRRVFFGVDRQKMVPMQRFLGSLNFSMYDALGEGFKHPSAQNTYVRMMNDRLNMPSEEEPSVSTVNDIIETTNKYAELVANMPEPTVMVGDEEFDLRGPKAAIFFQVRQFVARKLFEDLREEVRDVAKEYWFERDPTKVEAETILEGAPPIAHPALLEQTRNLKRQMLQMEKELRERNILR